MTSPARQGYRPVPERLPEFPTITRHTTNTRQVGQITYLIWRLEMFLKDRDAPRGQVKEQIQRVRTVWSRGDYENTCKAIESVIKAHLWAQFQQLQAICDER